MYIYIHKYKYKKGCRCFRGSGKVLLSGRYDCCYGGLPLKQRAKIYQFCVRPVLLYCCKTWELTVADEGRAREVECRMISMICGVRLVDRVSTDVLRDRLGVAVKTED